MKSERRHHLQQNELAGHLGKARHWIEPYTVPILAGIVVLVLGAILVGFLRSRAANERSDATLGLLLSTAQEDAEAYNLVTTDFAGTAPAVIATLAKADAYLNEAIEAMYSDRELAHGRLDDAIAAYRQVLDQATATLLQSRAAYGLAQALETQGDLDEAVAAYRQVIQLEESEEMVEVAEERIAALERGATREFVSWFAEQKPTMFDPGAPPGMPDAGSLPEMPDFNLPGLDPSAIDPAGGETGASGEPTGAAGGDEATEGAAAVENPEIALPEEGDELDDRARLDEGEGPTADPTEDGGVEASEEPAVEEPAVEELDVEESETDEDESTEQAENVQP